MVKMQVDYLKYYIDFSFLFYKNPLNRTHFLLDQLTNWNYGTYLGKLNPEHYLIIFV